MFGKDVAPDQATRVTNVVHWLYGVSWGGVYGLVEATAERNPVVAGTGFGSFVFATGYVTLPAMGIYNPPWEYDKKTLATDLSYHLVYGVATGLAFRLLEPRSR